jgi:hypothetical protein
MKRKFVLPWRRSKMDLFPPNQYRGWNAPHEKSRLVTPRAEPTPSLTPLKLLDEQPRVTEADDHGITDLLIQGLLDRLPKPNAIWSLEDRAKWLRTAASIFGLVYKSSDGDRRELGVVLLKPDAGNGSMTEVIVPGFIGQ